MIWLHGNRKQLIDHLIAHLLHVFKLFNVLKNTNPYIGLAMKVPSKDLLFNRVRPKSTNTGYDVWKVPKNNANIYPLDFAVCFYYARVLWMTDTNSSCGLCHIKSSDGRYFEAKWLRMVRYEFVIINKKCTKLMKPPAITVFDPIPIGKPSGSGPPTDRRTDSTKSIFGHYIGSSFIDGLFYNHFSLF